MGIQKKVTIAILIAGLIALLMSLSVTYYQVKNILTESIGRDFEESAKKGSERIALKVKDEITIFRYLAENRDVILGIKEDRGEAIEVYFKYYLDFAEEKKPLGLFIVNKKGRIIARGNLPSGYNLDQSDEPWWKITYDGGKGKIYVSDIYLDKLSGGRAFDIAIPVLDPETDLVVGAIRNILNADAFFSFVKEMNFGETGHGMLLNSEGTPLVCPLLPLVKHSMNQPLINLITNLITGNKTGWAIAADDAHGGRNSIIGFSPVMFINSIGAESLNGHKWYIFIRQDPKETFAPVNRLILKLFLFESAIVMIISVLAFFIVRKLFIQPVNLIHDGIDSVRKGALDYKIDIHTGDELESLAKGFNRMGDALKGFYYDLEEKIKERTRELEKTKNYLESILRYSTDMIITTDPGGRIVTFNDGAERMLGYERKEVIGTFMADYYIHKADRGKLVEMIESGSMVTNYETQLLRRDGKMIDISLSLSQLRDEKGKIIGTVGISKDITEWKKAQQQLKEYSHGLESMVGKRTVELEESNAHLEAMLGGIADGVVFADQGNKVTFLNDTAEQIFGIKRDEWLGRDFKDAHSSESHEKALRLVNDMREGRVKSYSSEIKSGEKTVFANFSPIMHGPEYLGVIFIARDITEMKRLQAELQSSEERYKDLIENSPEMIHSVNADRYFVGVNKTELNTLGYTLEEMLNKRLEDIVPDEYKDEYKEGVKRHIERVIKEGRSKVETQFIAKDGRKIDVEISATAFYHPITGQFIKTRAFVRDVTEVKRLQAELVQSEKLALVGKMSSTIAHEIRNPLVPIGGFASLIYKRLEDKSPLKQYADIIVKEIQRLEGLLHNILYFTKEIKPVLKPVNLNEIINDIISLYYNSLIESSIRMDIRLTSDMPEVNVDPFQIKQALINLISNALQAMPEGGTLTIESMIKDTDGKPNALMRISDTGMGIPEEIRKSIFEPFYTTKIHGLGLGLTLTRRIIEAHGGRIEIESTQGRGSTFIISLPY